MLRSRFYILGFHFQVKSGKQEFEIKFSPLSNKPNNTPRVRRKVEQITQRRSSLHPLNALTDLSFAIIGKDLVHVNVFDILL